MLYPDPLSQTVYLSMLQTFFDRSDPSGLARSLAEYTPPESNVVPTQQNGVHGDAPRSAEALWQTLELLSTGEAWHPCDGACDPD